METDVLSEIEFLESKSTEELIIISQTTIFRTEKQYALEIICERYTGVIKSVTVEYLDKGVPFDDLMQEGRLGLIHAVEKFDIKKGSQFSTYAFWWIKHYCRRTVDNQSSTIKVPVYIRELIRRTAMTRIQLMATLGREPLTREIADVMGIPINDLYDLLHRGAVLNTISLEMPFGNSPDNEDKTTADSIQSTYPSPIWTVEQAELRKQILLIFERCLTDKEVKFLSLQFGIKDGIDRTSAEIGRLLGLTKERPRQINRSTMKILEQIPEMQQLADMYL